MDRTRRLSWGAASIGTLLVLWALSAQLYPAVIPGIVETAAAFVTVVTTAGPYGNYVYFHVYKTTEMIILSIAVSLVLGTVFGVALGISSPLEDALSSWIYAWLAIPSLVIVFIAGIWIGFEAAAGFLAVPVVITPFVTLNMWEGARNLDDDLDEMAQFFGADRYQQFTDIILPQLTPFLFASVRSALSIGWKITLLVEAFLLTRGVGFMFKYYFDQYNLTMMTSWIIIFILVLVVIEYGLVIPVRNRVTHWRPDVTAVRGGE